MQRGRTSRRWLPRLLQVGLLAAALAGCSPAWPDLPPVIPPEWEPPTSLRAAFDGLGPYPHESELILLTDNAESWAHRWEMLESAERSIDVVYFIVEKDAFGLAFLGHLYRKALDGVRVRLLIDARGTKRLTRPFSGLDYLDELVSTGDAEIHVYNPPLERTLEAVATLRVLPAAASNHDKILLVNGERGVIGGRNVAAPLLRPARGRPSRHQRRGREPRGRGGGRHPQSAWRPPMDRARAGAPLPPRARRPPIAARAIATGRRPSLRGGGPCPRYQGSHRARPGGRHRRRPPPRRRRRGVDPHRVSGVHPHARGARGARASERARRGDHALHEQPGFLGQRFLTSLLLARLARGDGARSQPAHLCARRAAAPAHEAHRLRRPAHRHRQLQPRPPQHVREQRGGRRGLVERVRRGQPAADRAGARGGPGLRVPHRSDRRRPSHALPPGASAGGQGGGGLRAAAPLRVPGFDPLALSR